MQVKSKINGELLIVLGRDERRSPCYPEGMVHVRPATGRRAHKDYWVQPSDLIAA